ncbi:MAG TPA: DegV family protein, partial [Myxococcaceae bacterium]|nr:DegV family protein [Myxococcaceae bacterium]
VPDGDTGTNFTLTLRAVADALRALGDAPLPDTARTLAQAAVLGARGNSGMMLAHFLLGFTEALGDRTAATAPDIARAIRTGADRLYQALDDPQEGTILTVARDAAIAAEPVAQRSPDLVVFMRHLLEEGEAALARTPELMQVLKDAGVVDAGGKGFVRMLEGVVRYIRGDPVGTIAGSDAGPAPMAVPAAITEVASERDFQFCTEVLVRGERLPSANEVRSALHAFGGSTVVAVTGDILKIHVHTDTPEAVFTYAARWGRIDAKKAEDMRVQHRRLGHQASRPVAIVTDTSADVPDSELDRLHIAMVPLQVVFGESTFRDRVELKPEEFYRRLRATTELPTTSQPAPADFMQVFRDARSEANEVVAVLLGSSLSGTFKAAQAAVRAGGLQQVHLVDSKSASLGVGLLAIRGAELAASGWSGSQIADELRRVRTQSGMLLTVERYDHLLRSGRISRAKAWLAGMLDVKPILSLDAEGVVVPVERVRGRENLESRLLAILDQRLTPRPRELRLGVAHADAPEVAQRIRNALVERYQPRECLVTLATGVLGTHVGPGAWGIFYQVEDGAPGRAKATG